MAKVNLHFEFKEFLESLNSAKIEYLILGGYAVNFYGYRRATDDLDIWIAVDPESAAKMSSVLQSFAGFPPSKVKPSFFEEPGKVFIFGREPLRIDILTGPSGVVFRECYARRKTVEWDGLQVPLISLDDLRANKIASGRAKDLADLQNLPQVEQSESVPTKPRRTRRK